MFTLPGLPAIQEGKLRALLADSLPPAHLTLLNWVAEAAAERSLPLYLVGGFVRDLLLGYPVTDFDLVVEGNAIALARHLVKIRGGRVKTHTRFGTAQWHLPESFLDGRESSTSPNSRLSTLDLITSRSESYARPGALPTVKTGTLTDDLRRRDFTVNTLALRLDGNHFGELRDDLGGLDDLREGVLRVLHTASFLDDPTRILRAVRYEQRYEFQIHPTDIKLIKEASRLLKRISGQRLRHELDLILGETKTTLMLGRLADLGILEEIHSALKWERGTARLIKRLEEPEPDSWQGIPDLPGLSRRVAMGYLLWLGHLDERGIRSLAKRLDFSAGLRQALLAVSLLLSDLGSMDIQKPSAVVSRLDGLPPLAVCAAGLQVEAPAQRSLNSYLTHWRHVRPRTSGRSLVKRGLTPGPVFRDILWRLRAAYLDGEINSAEEEKALLEELINKK